MNESAVNKTYQCPRCGNHLIGGKSFDDGTPGCISCREWLENEAPSREEMSPEVRIREMEMWKGPLSVPFHYLRKRFGELVGRPVSHIELVYGWDDLLLEAQGLLDAPTDELEHISSILPDEVRSKFISFNLNTGEHGPLPDCEEHDWDAMLNDQEQKDN